MFGGAVAGALLILPVDAIWPLAISSGIVAGAAVVMWRRPAAELDPTTSLRNQLGRGRTRVTPISK
jgi:hypothetical protein